MSSALIQHSHEDHHGQPLHGLFLARTSRKTGARQPDGGAIEKPNGAAHFLGGASRSEEHTSELQSRGHLVCRPLREKKNSKMGLNYTEDLRIIVADV